MIKLKPILEKSVKADFIKAISSHKPVVSYRVHADIGDDKVGITGWYTIAVIHDVIDDIKKTGVTILGIEKSTDLKKLHKNIDGIRINESHKQQLNEDGWYALIKILTMLFTPLILALTLDLIGKIIKTAMKMAYNIKNYVSPSKYFKFLNGLANNSTFAKQLTGELKSKGGIDMLKRGSVTDISKIFSNLPEFDKAFNKFVKQEKVEKGSVEELKKEIVLSMATAFMDNAEDAVREWLKKYPEYKKQLQLNEMLVSDRTDGRVKQMLKKMQSNYPSLNAINYETRDRTYLFAFGKKSDADKLEKDFKDARKRNPDKAIGKFEFVRSADYPNDKPPVFVKQFRITEAWLKPASPLIEADSPTERTRRYNRKNKKKVRAYLRKTQDDRVARNGDRAKAIKKHGKAKLNGKDVHHPNGAQNGNWRVVKGDHGPDKKN